MFKPELKLQDQKDVPVGEPLLQQSQFDRQGKKCYDIIINCKSIDAVLSAGKQFDGTSKRSSVASTTSTLAATGTATMLAVAASNYKVVFQNKSN